MDIHKIPNTLKEIFFFKHLLHKKKILLISGMDIHQNFEYMYAFSSSAPRRKIIS
jgi:hypothetical protein